ncbi:MAG: hypothetical protein KBT72_06285 [Zhongshania sp.]|nr:hypothetical protein [Zhongshania sp.]
MADQNRVINIKEIVDLKERELNGANSYTFKLNLTLQSAQKCIGYCKYHYLEVEKFSGKTHLELERRLDLKYEGISIRTIYEANVFAFIQSLHALLDSLPYGLNIFYNVYPEIEAPNIGWNKDFISKYVRYSFYSSLKTINENETFAKLKSITNKVKHKHIIRIRNTYETLIFDDFTYYFGGETKNVKSEEVKKVLTDCHDYLLPKYIDFWNEVKNCKDVDLGYSIEK